MIFYFSGNPRQAAGSIFEHLQEEIRFFKQLGESYIRLVPYNSLSFKVRDTELVRDIATECNKISKRWTK